MQSSFLARKWSHSKTLDTCLLSATPLYKHWHFFQLSKKLEKCVNGTQSPPKANFLHFILSPLKLKLSLQFKWSCSRRENGFFSARLLIWYMYRKYGSDSVSTWWDPYGALTVEIGNEGWLIDERKGHLVQRGGELQLSNLYTHLFPSNSVECKTVSGAGIVFWFLDLI